MDTEQALNMWRGAQHDSERMCAQLLLLVGYKEVDPSHPLGGPDGTKDAVCLRNGERWVMAVYFTRESVDFKAIEKKFRDDAEGIAKNSARGIAFFTNNKLTISERDALSLIVTGQGYAADIYHGERVRLLLDDPRGYGTRFKFLKIPMSEAEQASFFEVYNQAVLAKLDDVRRDLRDLHEHSAWQREQFADIQATLRKLEAAAGQINLGAVLPVAPRTPSVVPAPASQDAQDEDEELVEVYPAPAPAASNEEGGAV